MQSNYVDVINTDVFLPLVDLNETKIYVPSNGVFYKCNRSRLCEKKYPSLFFNFPLSSYTSYSGNVFLYNSNTIFKTSIK